PPATPAHHHAPDRAPTRPTRDLRGSARSVAPICRYPAATGADRWSARRTAAHPASWHGHTMTSREGLATAAQATESASASAALPAIPPSGPAFVRALLRASAKPGAPSNQVSGVGAPPTADAAPLQCYPAETATSHRPGAEGHPGNTAVARGDHAAR